jgi:hypothetical protein
LATLTLACLLASHSPTIATNFSLFLVHPIPVQRMVRLGIITCQILRAWQPHFITTGFHAVQHPPFLSRPCLTDATKLRSCLPLFLHLHTCTCL